LTATTTAARTAWLSYLFRGGQVASSPQGIAALQFYRQVAINTLARYEAMGYVGAGVATQQERLRIVNELLQRWNP
jgi:hypothetical protein